VVLLTIISSYFYNVSREYKLLILGVALGEFVSL